MNEGKGSVMTNERVDSLYIGDTHDGKVFVSRSPATDLVDGPLQLLLITGKDNITPPNMLMTRQEFRGWRAELEDEGCIVELRFAS